MNIEVVKDYYGKVLKSSGDLKTSACCDGSDLPAHVKSLRTDGPLKSPPLGHSRIASNNWNGKWNGNWDQLRAMPSRQQQFPLVFDGAAVIS